MIPDINKNPEKFTSCWIPKTCFNCKRPKNCPIDNCDDEKKFSMMMQQNVSVICENYSEITEKELEDKLRAMPHLPILLPIFLQFNYKMK